MREAQHRMAARWRNDVRSVQTTGDDSTMADATTEQVEAKELYGIARTGMGKSKDLYDQYGEIGEDCLKFGRAYKTRCSELEAIKVAKGIGINGPKLATLDKDSMNENDWGELHQALYSLAIARVANAKEEFFAAIKQSMNRLQVELLGE
jgi:hypothetical protein